MAKRQQFIVDHMILSVPSTEVDEFDLDEISIKHIIEDALEEYFNKLDESLRLESMAVHSWDEVDD